MAVATFPHMNEYSPAFRMILEELGHEVIMPLRPSKRTLTLGSSFGPEFACIPLKILLGTYLEAIEKGANLIVTSGGVGPCRAGLYASMHKEILRSLGHDIDMVVFEPIRHKPLDLLKSVHRLNVARLMPWQLFDLLYRAWQMISYLDQLEHLLHWTRPRELKPGTADAIYRAGVDSLCKERSLKGITSRGRQAVAEMKAIPIDKDADPLKIGIVGEIYVVIEPAANLDIERILGELGVEVHRSIFLTGWTKENVVKEGHRVKAGMVARPYLGEMVGGHGQESIGHTILYAREGLDGVVQLAPFTCIPEIVAKSILPAVSRDFDIPVISFFLDEQTGEAGFRTRLEAFVDLLARRRSRKRQEKQPA